MLASRTTIRQIMVIATSLLLAVFVIAKDKDEEVPPEYKELYQIVELEKTLTNRMKSDVPEEKLDKEIELRIKEIDEAYKDYIERYPRSTFGQILYGKFLRKIDRPDDAYAVFLDIHEDNPDIPVVNQHLALFASEIGDFKVAYKYFEKAIELDPSQALYYYQLGEFLYTYKMELMKNHILSISEIEEKMVSCFQKAHELNRENRDFHVRWAESYFDKFNPDWNSVLKIWDELLETSQNLFEREVLQLQKVRVLLELKRYPEANEILKSVSDPSLAETKEKLTRQIP